MRVGVGVVGGVLLGGSVMVVRAACRRVSLTVKMLMKAYHT